MYIKVKVFPKSKKEEIKKTKGQENRFEVKVKEKAEKNLANTRVLELLAEYFEINKKDISIINGHHHPIKLLRINDDVL
ncbi:MAG: DUF167 domain-containing protein [Candidatus Pacebacteria bacterium]|nr:DUF167 domain-containing protein [Candidatus Paceibacterota bacterium]